VDVVEHGIDDLRLEVHIRDRHGRGADTVVRPGGTDEEKRGHDGESTRAAETPDVMRCHECSPSPLGITLAACGLLGNHVTVCEESTTYRETCD
jgi:hypothetical protein